ncbi:MAG: efflux transporter outer membrane subunit [Betaproteobacteria bacterium]|nr:efflux transporter outer membrane subunit [Betaproteobacteria bacterium]
MLDRIVPDAISARPLAALLASLALAGCAVGPDYQRPAADLPQAWPAAPAGAAANASAARWWTIYGDGALNTLVDEALAKNTDLAVAAARVTEAEAQLGLQRTNLSPTTYADGGRGRNRTSAKSGQFQEGMPLETTSHRAQLNVSYELDFWGKYRRATEAAKAELLATEAARDTVRLTLVAQVVQGHYGLLAQDARVAATQRTLERGREALRLLTKQFEVGMISRFDLQQRSAEIDAVEAQLPPLMRDRATQERALAVLLGRAPREVVDANIRRDGERANATTLNLAAPAGLPSELLLARPDLREAEQRLVAANARIGVARAAYFPSITLTGAIGSESAQLSDLFSGPARTWNFAGNITQALWGAGRLMREEEIAEVRQKIAVEQYRAAVINAFREVQDAVGAQAAARDVFVAETRRVESLRQAYALAKLRFENGIASQLDVIDNERSLVAAEHNRIEAERALRAAIADLYRALGAGAAKASA